MGKNRNQSAPATKNEGEASAAPELATLLGSSVQPSTVKVAGFDVELGQAVRAAFENSGLTVDEWNALADEDREARIAAVIDPAAELTEAEQLEVADGTPAADLTALDPSVAPEPEDGKTAEAPNEALDAESDPGPAAEVEAEVEAAPADPVRPPPSVALIKGVLQDYERVMAVGQQPDPSHGSRAQQALLRMVRALTGDTRDAATEGASTILEFFAQHEAGMTSESHLARFVSADELALLLSVRASAVGK
ncbi:hypothetical protein D3C71_79320 [compost metagenome]